MTKSVYAGSPDRVHVGPRLHLSLPAPAPDDRGLPHDRHPVVRPRPRAKRGTALPRAGSCARSLAFAVPAGVGTAVASMLSFFFVDSLAGGTLDGGANRRDGHADRARPLLHPAARARAGPRAHHDPDLHARDDRRARALSSRRRSRSPPSASSSSSSMLSAGQWFLSPGRGCRRPRDRRAWLAAAADPGAGSNRWIRRPRPAGPDAHSYAPATAEPEKLPEHERAAFRHPPHEDRHARSARPRARSR